MKTKLLLFTLLLASSLCCMSCDDGGDDLTPQLPNANGYQKQGAMPLSVPSFSGPASTIIDEKKARQYAGASAALVLLGEQWSSKIEEAKGQDKVVILQNYEKAREQVCIRVGLAGLAEYNWITSAAMKDSSNADVFLKAGIKVTY